MGCSFNHVGPSQKVRAGFTKFLSSETHFIKVPLWISKCSTNRWTPFRVKNNYLSPPTTRNAQVRCAVSCIQLVQQPATNWTVRSSKTAEDKILYRLENPPLLSLGAHLYCHTMGNGVPSRGYTSQGVKVITHLQLTPTLRMSAATGLVRSPHMALKAQEVTTYFLL